MRESIGATWVLSICLTFIVLFTAYIAISINYSKAFMVKSHIVSMVEENEGLVKNGDNGDFKKALSSYLAGQNYSGTGACPDTYTDQDGSIWERMILYNRPTARTSYEETTVNGTSVNNNCMVAIYRKRLDVNSVTNTNANFNPTCANLTQYRVMTFFNIDIPVINIFTHFRVAGDTNTIYDFQNSITDVCGKKNVSTADISNTSLR